MNETTEELHINFSDGILYGIAGDHKVEFIKGQKSLSFLAAKINIPRLDITYKLILNMIIIIID